MVNAMNREGCIDTGSNPVLTAQKTRNRVSLPHGRWVLKVSPF